MNKDKLINVLRENESYKIKVDRLNKSLERLQSRYNDTESDLSAYKKKNDFLKEQFREIVRNCFPREYIEGDMGKRSDMELYEYIVEKVNSLEQDNFYTKREKEKLADELNTTMVELERLQNAGPMLAPSSSDDSIGESDGLVSSVGNMTATPVPVSVDENPLAGVLSLLEEKDWPYIQSVGKGTTLFSDIVSEVGTSNAVASPILSALVEKGLINFTKIQKGGKGRPAHHYFLTSLGTKAYELKFEESAETTILEKMSTHGSPHHGGLMVEVGSYLEENGCVVTYDGPDTTFRLRSGRDIIFDIKAFDRETKETLLIETERARCGEQHLQEKFDKCLEFMEKGITKSIHIVAPDKESLHTIQQNLFKWVKQQRNTLMILSGNNIDKAIIVFKTATLEDFKKGKLQIFYYGKK